MDASREYEITSNFPVLRLFGYSAGWIGGTLERLGAPRRAADPYGAGTFGCGAPFACEMSGSWAKITSVLFEVLDVQGGELGATEGAAGRGPECPKASSLLQHWSVASYLHELPMSDVDWLALWAEFAQATDNKQLEVAERIVYLDGRWDFNELSSSKLIAAARQIIRERVEGRS
jgi:hypothetical protein